MWRFNYGSVKKITNKTCLLRKSRLRCFPNWTMYHQNSPIGTYVVSFVRLIYFTFHASRVCCSCNIITLNISQDISSREAKNQNSRDWIHGLNLHKIVMQHESINLMRFFPSNWQFMTRLHFRIADEILQWWRIWQLLHRCTNKHCLHIANNISGFHVETLFQIVKRS